ncbi:MAG: hypothetical protein L6V93_10530 [Clostridiales bacterium]|nr:MAG: hypothetical protein L6V93_10530 [Clostridiales bacterium]
MPCRVWKNFSALKTKAHASAIAIILPLTVISIFFSTQKGDFSIFPLVWQTSLGGVFGGLIGAWVLKN